MGGGGGAGLVQLATALLISRQRASPSHCLWEGVHRVTRDRPPPSPPLRNPPPLPAAEAAYELEE